MVSMHCWHSLLDQTSSRWYSGLMLNRSRCSQSSLSDTITILWSTCSDEYAGTGSCCFDIDMPFLLMQHTRKIGILLLVMSSHATIHMAAHYATNMMGIFIVFSLYMRKTCSLNIG